MIFHGAIIESWLVVVEAKWLLARWLFAIFSMQYIVGTQLVFKSSIISKYYFIKNYGYM